MNPILPIAGVPDELLRVLNDRFRQLEASVGTAPAATPVATPAPAPARDLGTPVQGADVLVDINRIPKVATVGRLTESCITDDGAQVSITGALGCGGNTSPAYPLDVTGDINTSTGYRMAGNAGLSPAGFTIVALAKLTSGGVGGSITIRGGIVTNYIAPT